MTDLQTSLILTDNNLKDLPDTFQSIARNLMCNYIIKKGEKKYAVVEIEFYLYAPHHQDFITYPRKVEAGRWFFHQSGVDLTFSTIGSPTMKFNERGEKYLDYSNCTFGGILVRGLYKLDNSIKEEDRYIFGPQKCVNELWDNFDAFTSSNNEYPILKEVKEPLANNFLQCKRHINIQEKDKITKVQSWAKRAGIKIEDDKTLRDSFDFTKNRKYRFFNMQNGENPCEFKKIPNEARPKEYEIIKID